MSFIACAEDCVYQKDGCCRLERVSFRQSAASPNGCLYQVPVSAQNGSYGLPDAADRNELQA
jgi:hypothetical protein